MGPMEKILRLMSEKRASDVYLSAASPVQMKLNGVCTAITPQPLPVDGPLQLLAEVVSAEQLREFHASGELNIAIPLAGVGRFRLSAMKQRGNCAMVVRFISSEIPAFESLQLPPVLAKMIMAKRGLMLVVGSTGSGKSTTLAALLDHRNAQSSGHILTIEDPIEFVHESKKSLINQREVSTMTLSFAAALRSALREDPDVVLVGEMRDLETIRLAMTAAETGHLVFGTLHTSSAAKTIDRIIDVFPPEEKEMVRAMLSESLVAVISQTLLKTADGNGRVAAHEIMMGTPAIRNLIRENKVAQMYSAIQTGNGFGMQTLDQSLMNLVRGNRVHVAEARAKAKIPENFPG